ncbi:tyrosine--tRNA ligase [Oscillospiraceae bacterium OttesenSCG-928-G22]|nr:tyrosine--tRNA ligase [Oscillospiraceae bacterium OttesenSCG-928-G22]
MTVFEELKARGLIAQCTNEEETQKLIDSGRAVFYTGFDPTADSLHVGHLMQLIVMRHLQNAGNRPIALLGGGTTMVGDPSGRTDMRSMLTQEEIQKNAARFKVQMSKVVDFSEGKAMMLDNAEWLLTLNYVEFLREVGVHFSVNRMLTAEAFKSRMERGLSFIEFNYMLMQSYDYYMLNQKYGVNLQCGGDDQWSNIISGVDLVRRKAQKEVYGLTFTLLLTSEGKKMGKTMQGAVWLDPEKLSIYDFYQYWRNTADNDVINFLRMCTFVPLDELGQYAGLSGADLNPAKERLAYEVTKIVHGEAEAEAARNAARAIFVSGAQDANMPETELSADDFTGGEIGVLDLLVKTGLAPSKGEARRLVDQGGITAGDEKVESAMKTFSEDDCKAPGLVIRKGKKVYHRAILK